VGNIVKNTENLQNIPRNVPVVIAIGDIISASLSKIGLTADISIIDYKSRRHKLVHGLPNAYISEKASKTIGNPPGTIQSAAVQAYIQALQEFLQTGNKQIIVIDGEEDLLALPSILLAPLQAVVLYGQ